VSIDSGARVAAWLGALAAAAIGTAHAQPRPVGQYEQADIEYGARLYACRCVA